MGKLDAILLLLAGLQIHIGVAYGTRSLMKTIILSRCPIMFFGTKYRLLQVYQLKGVSTEICFASYTSDPPQNCLTIADSDTSMWQITRQGVPEPACAYELTGLAQIFTAQQASIISKSFSKQIPIGPISVTSLEVRHQITAMAAKFRTRQIPSYSTYFQIKFEQQNAISPSYVTVNALPAYPDSNIIMTGRFNGQPLGKWLLSANETDKAIMLRGCQEPNSTSLTGSQASKLDPQTCVGTACDSSLSLSTTKCGEDLVCNRDSSCVLTPVCTVTASTVIDFHGAKHDVPTRCMYTLVNSTFFLLAGFRERRRQDMSFLDHLELSIYGDTIVLDQGGRVLVNGQTVTLNATAVKHGVVELSNNKTGVTAKLPNHVTIFFDGNTAHIAGQAFTGNEDGLCGRPFDSSQQVDMSVWKSGSSHSGCEIKHKDTSGAVDCTITAARCDLLNEEPFTACHDTVDKDPYIYACNKTLCEYPAVDGLKCQFLEAYARVCSLRNTTIELGDWRSKANCHPSATSPQALCQDQYCAADEFCGEHNSRASCLCRALFAAKYKPSKSLGDAAVCTDNSATVTLAGCLLTEQGIDHSLLHLKDETCKGKMDSNTHKVTFSFNTRSDCGAELMMNNSQVIFKNTIMTGNTSKDGIINRHDRVAIDFSCIYNKPTMPNRVSLRVKDSSVVQKIKSGNWSYTLTMNAYTDSGLRDVISGKTELTLGQKIWVELKTEGLDDTRVAMVTDSCWATNVQLQNATLRYDLIKNKCPDDKTVKFQGNGEGTSNSFSFSVFEFAEKNSDVYLHCKLELCLKNGNSCVPNCNREGRVKRSSSRPEFADKNPALITMAWTN